MGLESQDVVDAALADCERVAAAGGRRSAPIGAALSTARGRLGAPMRVAVAGQIKRGKSTLVNALLGQDVAPTAQLEATFTVSEFRHADESGVLVHYLAADTPPLAVAVERFRAFTVNDPDQAALLRGVRRVEYGLPNALLRTFRLVDTPGLGSVHGVDSDNTADFLGIGGFLAPDDEAALLATLQAVGRTASDVHDDSAHELDRADAIVYLFDRAANERDLAAVADFLGPLAASMTPMKAFGVLSRCDETYWPPGEDQPGDSNPLTWNPLDVAARVVAGYRRRPEIRRMFYTILPVAGLVAVAARTLDDEHFGWLNELSGVDPPRLAGMLSDAGRFATRPTIPGVALDPARRTQLIRRLGAWGSLRACGYLRDGVGVDEVRNLLVDDSGVTRLRETIRSHFGNRADLLKLDHGLGEVTAAVARCRVEAQRAGEQPPQAAAVVAAAVQDLRARQQGFAELAVLALHYNGELDLSECHGTELLQVTGEHGVTDAERLGLPAATGAAELERVAMGRLRSWSLLLQDPLLDRRTTDAARTVLRSYDGVVTRIRATMPAYATGNG